MQDAMPLRCLSRLILFLPASVSLARVSVWGQIESVEQELPVASRLAIELLNRLVKRVAARAAKDERLSERRVLLSRGTLRQRQSL